MRVAIGALGKVGPVEFIGNNAQGERRVCVRFSPAWRHFAHANDVRAATRFEAARWAWGETVRRIGAFL